MPKTKKMERSGLKRTNMGNVVTPQKYLELHGKSVDKVYAVWSPGDSDFGYETILYVTEKGKPKTAVIVEEWLICKDGWDWFNVAYV